MIINTLTINYNAIYIYTFWKKKKQSDLKTSHVAHCPSYIYVYAGPCPPLNTSNCRVSLIQIDMLNEATAWSVC